MNNQTPIPNDHPLKLAWDKYTATEDYANARRWAKEGDEFIEGSLWAAFVEGWNAGVSAVKLGVSHQ